MPAPRVLVVDDDQFFRELFQDVLASSGHAVTCVADVEQAEPHLATTDVLVTDLVMAGSDGIALTLLARAAQPEIEVIVVSQQEEIRAAVDAIKAGAAEYLVKPVEPDQLTAAVDRAVARIRLRSDRQKLLDENLEFLKHQALYERCLELLSTLDPERLQEVALRTLTQVVEAESGALWTADDTGKLVLRGWRGGLDRERLRARLDPKEDGLVAKLRAGVAYPAHAGPPGAVELPLRFAGELQGLVLLSDRAGGGKFTEADLGVARVVGDFAAIAVKNSRRFAQVERAGLRDRETAAYNLAYFVDYASKESYKARRYGRTFSLVTLTIDNLDELRRVLGRDDAARVTRGVLTGVARVCRDADVVAKVADNEFYVLLPETDHFGALMFRRRAVAAARGDRLVRELGTRVPLQLSVGLSTFPGDGHDFDELLHHSRARAEEARRSLVRTLQLEELDFWATLDVLLGAPGAAPLPEDAGPGASRRCSLPRPLFHAAQAEAARELGRDPAARGLLYLCNGEELLDPELPVLAALPPLETQGRVYLLGRRGVAPPEHPGATAVYLDGDDRIARHEFLLFFTEHSAYGLVRRLGAADAATFHTSDAPLVDHLVARLQERYDLQPY